MKRKRITMTKMVHDREDKTTIVTEYVIPDDFEIPEDWRVFRTAFLPSLPDRELAKKVHEDAGWITSYYRGE
jgi:hypothetical protein